MKLLKLLIPTLPVFMHAGLCSAVSVNALVADNPNLLTNPGFNSSSGWSLSPRTSFVASVSQTAGSGSIRFSVKDPGAESAWYAQIQSSRVKDFKYLTPYTITAFVRGDFTPTYLEAFLQTWDANGKVIPYGDVSTTTGMASTATAGEWQEVRFMVSVNSTKVKEIAVCIGRSMNDWGLKDFYVDTIRFSEGIPPLHAANLRRPFNGTKVRIDDQGNWSLREGGSWKPFFPFGLYPYLSRKDYSSLSKQGFNLVLSQQYAGQVEVAKNAISNFNPTGMKAGLRISKYATPGDKYWTLSRLKSEIQLIASKEQNQPDASPTLIMYDWDNENNWKTWQHWSQMVSMIRSSDAQRPIYILNGYPGVQPSFDKLSDVSGTYVGLDFSGKYESGFAKYEVLNNSLVQQTPASIAQLNDIENRSFGFREMTYNAIIKGAKGIVMWGDGVAAADGKTLVFVESRAWWTDIPKLRRELDQLLPALEKPPSKNLALFTTDPEVRFDIRQLDNQFVLIMLNSGAAQKLVTFVSPTYRINQITNYFDDSTISRPGTNSFSLTIPAHSTAVYSLSASEVKLEGLPPAPLPPTFN